ncbi:MAG: hypothetical protein C0524_09825 [Rhodobacter sp.]|nr:hypothetical protein [Rhodobacter sp.]
MGAMAVQQMADRVAGLMEERLNLNGRDLSAKVRRGGRLLPKKVRDAAQLLADAAEKSKNPKLLGQIDMGAVADAYDACVRHLMTVDPAERRRNLLAGMVGSVGFGVLALILGIIALLAWRGYL